MQKPLKHSEARNWISDLRFAPFLDAARGDYPRATALYLWNSELAGALLETFGHVEVFVRNAIHREMSSVRPTNALRSWLVDPDLLDSEQLRRVDEVVARLRKSKKQPTEDRVIAGLSLGFWTAMLAKKQEELWRQRLRRAFPNGDGTRAQAAGYVNRMAQLRNRVAHHEAIIDQPVADRLQDALELAGAIDPAAAAWIKTSSRVETLLAPVALA